MPRTSPPLKAALLGLNHPHSWLLLNTLENQPNISEIWVWGENERMRKNPLLRGRRKIAGFTTHLDRLLARSDIDFAVVCVPTDMAAAVSTQVVSSGKHLLAEKPAGMTAKEISQLIALTKRQGVQACVLYGTRTHPAV